MSTIFNSLDTYFKSRSGPIKEGEGLTFRVKLRKDIQPYNVKLVFFGFQQAYNSLEFGLNFEYSDENYDYFKVDIANLEINIYEYYFVFESYGSQKYLKKCYDSWEAFISTDNSGCNWQLTVYTPVKTHPNMNKGIMYQIFPDRFYRSGKTTNLPNDRTYRKWGELPFYTDDKICSDFFGGDLRGIIEKLDYLKSLSISVIYLNPIWESQSNHRYDTSDYTKVDPVLGNLDDVKELLSKAHSLGMIVILDTVLNHTGSDSIYFNKNNRYPVNGASNSPDSPYRNWYYFWTDGIHYESWWGFETLPKLNQQSEGYIDYFFNSGGVLDIWFQLGFDGLRLDVADELDNSTLNRIFESSKRNCDKIIIIGEVWDNASNKCNYGHRMEYFLGNELTSVMNYPVKDAILAYVRYGDLWSSNLWRTLISVYIEDYPHEIAYSLMNLLSTHDSVRMITKLAGKEVDDHDKNWQFENDTLSPQEYRLGRARAMISYLILYFLPGVPSIFYGDEIGLSGQKDPFCRKCFPWNRIDKKFLHFFKNLGKLRSSFADFLSIANFNIVKINNELCIFTRDFDDKSLLIMVNRADFAVDISDFSSNLRNISILFSIGNSTLQELDCFGALVLLSSV